MSDFTGSTCRWRNICRDIGEYRKRDTCRCGRRVCSSARNVQDRRIFSRISNHASYFAMSPHFPILNYHDLVSLARERGFVLWKSGKGSHEIWRRPSDGRRTVFSNHSSQPIKRKTLKSILEDLEIDPFDLTK